MTIDPPPSGGTNLAVLRGTIAADPIRRQLPAGGVVVQFDVVTPVREGDRTSSHATPVAWYDPPARADDLATGAEVVVVGSVRRRFFRVGGATQSRTEVRADRVLAARRRRQVETALAEAARTLSDRG